MIENKRFIEDVEVADELTPLLIHPTKDQIITYATLCGLAVFGRFTDDEVGKKEGLGGQIAPGNMLVGYLSRLLTDWSRNGTLRKLEVNFRGFIHPNDDLACRGIVTEKLDLDGENAVECDIFIENQDGEKLATGKGTMILPSRSAV